MKTASRFRIWFGGALAAFVDGFIDGCPIGAPAGVGGSIADGSAGEISNVTDWKHLGIVLVHGLVIPVFTGVADVRAWKKNNPFPNVFVPENISETSGNTLIQ